MLISWEINFFSGREEYVVQFLILAKDFVQFSMASECFRRGTAESVEDVSHGFDWFLRLPIRIRSCLTCFLDITSMILERVC